MAKFDYDDVVQVVSTAPIDLRPGKHASVVGVYEQPQRAGAYLAEFPSGTVYLVEFEGGDAISIHETMLEAARPPFFPR